MLTKIGIGILAGALTFGTGGAVAAKHLGVPGTGADRQARCETFQAAFAQNLGITTQQLQGTRKQTALQLIDEAAAAGKITPEQAQKAKDRVNASQGACASAGDRAPVKTQITKVELQAVAQKLGITESQLVQEVRGGKTLAQVAAAHNVGRDDLKATMHDAFKGELDKAVSNGRITQDQANTALAKFDAKLDTIVDRVRQGQQP
jgi:hypothetical protein